MKEIRCPREDAKPGTGVRQETVRIGCKKNAKRVIVTFGVGSRDECNINKRDLVVKNVFKRKVDTNNMADLGEYGEWETAMRGATFDKRINRSWLECSGCPVPGPAVTTRPIPPIG